MISSSESNNPAPAAGLSRHAVPALLVSVAVLSVCAITYQLLISTLSSYFLGSSVLHFSLVIGLFLSSMGLGSWISRYLRTRLLERFIQFELWLGVAGGCSAWLLYAAFSLTDAYYLIAFGLIVLLGTLIGIEIPVLTRVVREYQSLRDALARVFSIDYLGALIASVLFPLIWLPWLGIMRTAFLTGILNVAVAGATAWLFRHALQGARPYLLGAALAGAALLAGFIGSFGLVTYFEEKLYQDPILLSRQSRYQQIVLTRWHDDLRLYLNGNLQFSSRDEYRYHEPLVHIPMPLAAARSRILVLGGGDGLAVREILKYSGVDSVDVVDLDPEMTRLGFSHPAFIRLNDSAFHDPRVRIVNQDAYKYIESGSSLYDVAIIDLPDPDDTSVGKLYTQEFYRLLARRLAAGAAVVTQSTSPYFAPDAFWCIHHTLRAVFPVCWPYAAYIPSFGHWGFNVALNLPPAAQPSDTALAPPVETIRQRLFNPQQPMALRYLTPEQVQALFVFDGDMRSRPAELNRLDNQQLVRYYEASWNRWR
ncbi:MAG: polyamine aminopropyltransferase [Bacteroidia bacterium]|nr:polyamine aminopropyltransferase [Bacteroidia bacterium]